MFGYCCKCNEGNPAYYGGGAGGSGSGGGLYFNPYGVGGGCTDTCATVPYAFDADITSAGGCPCAGYGGTTQLQHVSGPYTFGLNYFSSIDAFGEPCDVWASSERALNSSTCAETTIPRYEVVLWTQFGTRTWWATWFWQIGIFTRQTRCSLGNETGTTCFDSRSCTGVVTSDGIPACVFTDFAIAPAA